MATKKRTSVDALADAAKAQADAKQLEKAEYEAYGRRLVKLTDAGGKGAPECIARSLGKLTEALYGASKQGGEAGTLPGERPVTVPAERPGTVVAHQPSTVRAQTRPQDSAHAVFEGAAGQGSRAQQARVRGSDRGPWWSCSTHRVGQLCRAGEAAGGAHQRHPQRSRPRSGPRRATWEPFERSEKVP